MLKELPKTCRKCPYISSCLIYMEIMRFSSSFSILSHKRPNSCPLIYNQGEGYIIDEIYMKKKIDEFNKEKMWKNLK